MKQLFGERCFYYTKHLIVGDVKTIFQDYCTRGHTSTTTFVGGEHAIDPIGAGYNITTIAMDSGRNMSVVEHSVFEVEHGSESMLLKEFPGFCTAIDTALEEGKTLIVHNLARGQLGLFMLCAYVMKVEGITPEEAFEYILDRIGDETEQGIPFEVFWPSDLCDQLRFWDGHKEELHTMMMD